MLFQTGVILATPGALELAHNHSENLYEYLSRHTQGDWGDLDSQDREMNDLAVINGERIFSAYPTWGGRIWIITEADRSATTILLPSEY